MLLDDYYWHYDYARLAWDTGFCFDKYKYPNLDKNKICLIDIDRIIKERDVASVERNIPTVVQYVLENDQADVLDSNFVKLFRLSQLSVEYLLFCKRYLDKTVVLLKKDIMKLKQEIKEHKQYTEELETHISSSRNPAAIYNCDKCSKMFSSEEYLNSHVKRRHSVLDNKEFTATTNSEAEKLHSEIKELKERLNNTEKFIQEKPSNREVDNYKEVSEEAEGKTAKLVTEIQESFEKFRKQVEEKMTSLQSEKNFFTDKYDKLFEIVIQYKNKEQDMSHQEAKIVEDKKVTEIPKIENTSTQTDETKKERALEMHTVQHDNTYIFKEKDEDTRSNRGVEDIDEKIERKLTNFEENIETKISTGLCNIENQIQSFWQKLSEGDLSNQPPITEVLKIIDQPVQTDIIIDIPKREEEKPKIKPRTKWTKPTPFNFNIVESENQKQLIQNELDEIVLAEKPTVQSVAVVKSATSNMYETSSEINSESEQRPCTDENVNLEQDISDDVTYSSPKIKEPPRKPKTVPSTKTDLKNIDDSNDVIVFKKPSKHILKKSADSDETLNNKIRKQLTDLIGTSLQEMGISPSWKGIPNKTFERAVEIVKHQAVLNKKSLPEYDSIKRSIEKLLKKKETPRKAQSVTNIISPNRKKSKTNTVTIQIRKNEFPESKSAPGIKIKNRSLYDTDSETDINTYLPKNFNQEMPSTPVSIKTVTTASSKPSTTATIKTINQEKYLKEERQPATPTDGDFNQNTTFDQEKAHSAVIEELQSKFSQKSADTDSDLNSIILSDDRDKKETKSALKTFSSEGSLVKKKVFFDVEDFENDDSVDDVLPELKNKQSKEDSLSDFEIT